MLGSKNENDYRVGRFELAYYFRDNSSDFQKVSVPVFSRDLLLTPEEFAEKYVPNMLKSLARTVANRIKGQAI